MFRKNGFRRARANDSYGMPFRLMRKGRYAGRELSFRVYFSYITIADPVESKERFVKNKSRLMRIYSPDEDEMLYLSPYVRITLGNDRLIIDQSLFGCRSILLCDPEFSGRLISAASGGMRTEDLVNMLTRAAKDKEEAEKLVENWIRQGVLE